MLQPGDDRNGTRQGRNGSSRGDNAGARVANEGISIGGLFGIPVQVDWSLLLAFVLVLFNLGAGVFALWRPDWSVTARWSLAFAAALSLFASVLVHELAHALVARAQGIPVSGITLFLFGGVTRLETEPKTPRAELLMALVSPITSLVLGLVATGIGVALAGDALKIVAHSADREAVREAMSTVRPLAVLLLWLGPINLMLAIFNMVPGFPLDGGRVLRSLLWMSTHDLLKATRWASSAGRVFGWVLIACGLTDFFAGVVGQGMWLVLIGWFLHGAARQSYEQLSLRHALQDVPVTRVMWTQPTRVRPDMTLDCLVGDVVTTSDTETFAVEADGALLGLVTLGDVRKVAPENWPQLCVADVMTPIEQLSTLSPDARAGQALEELGRRDVEHIPVLEGTHLRGIVRQRDLVRWMAFQRQTIHP